MLAALLSAVFVSCKDEMDEYEGDRPSRLDALAIKFNAFGDGFQKPETRAGIVESFTYGDKVSVLSMMTADGSSWSKVFANDAVEITNVGEYLWSYENKQKWIDGNTYKFKGFYPSSSDGFNRTAGEKCTDGFTWTVNGATTLTLTDYKSANDPRLNTDILVSDEESRVYSTALANNDPVSLNMKHILSCVNFKIKTKQGKKLHINKFKFVGYAATGNCVINQSPNWEIEYDKDNTKINVVFLKNYTNNQKTYNSNFDFYDLKTDEKLSFDDLVSRLYSENYHDPNKSYDYSYYILPGYFDLGPAETSGANSDNEPYVVDNYQRLLVIPQSINQGEKRFTLNAQIWGTTLGGDNNWYTYCENVLERKDLVIDRSVYGQIEYYFGEDSEHTYTAIVDLSAGNIVTKWEAGKIYTYTIGVNNFDINVEIEDWQHHKIEEEIK